MSSCGVHEKRADPGRGYDAVRLRAAQCAWRVIPCHAVQVAMSIQHIRYLICPALAFAPCIALAHANGVPERATIDPIGALLLAVIAFVYVRGEWRLSRGTPPGDARRRRSACFWLGWLALAVSLGPPLEAWTGGSFAAHMAQHEIMMLVAAPLMVVARPYGVILWGLPQPLADVLARLMQARGTRRVALSLCSPIVAWLLHAAVLWSWHVPPAFEAALANAPVHWIQHITFFLSAVIFWWSVFAPGPLAERRGAAIVSVFTTAVHTSLLGTLLTFSTRAWYPTYSLAANPWGLGAVEDQQLGGLIMWIPGGTVFLLAGLALTAMWLKDAEKRASSLRFRAMDAGRREKR
jgi:cytochrome c oxidase assembly factor CtaG